MIYAVRFVNVNGHYALPVRFNNIEAARRCAKRPAKCDVRFEIYQNDVCIEWDSY